MKLASEIKQNKKDIIYLSRYDVIQAFFKTEEDEDEEMAKELNVLLNCFCLEERRKKRSINVLPFSADMHKRTITYIKSSLNG